MYEIDLDVGDWDILVIYLFYVCYTLINAIAIKVNQSNQTINQFGRNPDYYF